jgi:hypothetical protein
MLGMLAAAVIAQSATPPPNWQLLFRDPPEGAVYMDLNSVWTRGNERAITARFAFDRPGAGDVAEILTRLEIDCATGSFTTRSAIGRDRRGAQLYAYAYSDGQVRRVVSSEGPSARLVTAVCSRAVGPN